MTLKHVHTRQRADGLKETVVEMDCVELGEKLAQVHRLCGEICESPFEAIVVLTKMLDIYKQHSETRSAILMEHQAQ